MVIQVLFYIFDSKYYSYLLICILIFYIGSPAVQIAIMTEKIKNLVRHFALHRKDHSSGRNFEILLSRRKRLLNYLRKYNFENFKVVIKELDLQKEGLELIRKNK